MENMMS